MYDKKISGHTDFGCTVIDLESRYYAKCYATCGLAKSYDISGYNTWKDADKPSQILNKMCKEYRIQLNLDEEKDVESLKNERKTALVKLNKDYIIEQRALNKLNSWASITKVSPFMIEVFFFKAFFL